MLKEIDLAPLGIVHNVPVRIWKSLAKPTIAHIWIAELRCFLSIRERLLLVFIKFPHESTSEDLDPGCHRNEVHGKDIHEYHSHQEDEKNEELLR